jgi:N-carbamoyl-L-amino-acid hydrolase
MEAAGLEVSIDAFGNMRGRRAGTEDLPAVMIGSHLDTVPEGGNYDGVVGVLAGLEVVRMMNDCGLETKRPLEIINFSAEESSRFGMATMGSKALAGKLDVDTLKRLIDKDGVSLYETLKSCGYAADEIASARIEPGSIHAFLEMHIEQGPVLENSNCPLGIVSAIAAPTRFKVTVEGRADHSGNTPMTMRRDALAGASELVLGVERITGSESGEKTVGTVGYQYVTPGAMNVVPGKVELGIDIRDVVMADKNKAVEAVIALMAEIAERRNLQIAWQQLSNDEPVTLSQRVIDLLRETAAENGLASMVMPSGAGHDAMNMAKLADTGMIFIPSIDGISHNIAEKSRIEDICTGTDLLAQTVVKLARE